MLLSWLASHMSRASRPPPPSSERTGLLEHKTLTHLTLSPPHTTQVTTETVISDDISRPWPQPAPASLASLTPTEKVKRRPLESREVTGGASAREHQHTQPGGHTARHSLRCSWSWSRAGIIQSLTLYSGFDKTVCTLLYNYSNKEYTKFNKLNSTTNPFDVRDKHWSVSLTATTASSLWRRKLV